MRVRQRAVDDIDLLHEMKRLPCADCGRAYPPEAMDFDHRDPSSKEFDILKRAGCVSRARLLTEVEKCDVVCANCHRTRTFAAFMDGLLRPPGFTRSVSPARTVDLQRRRDRGHSRRQGQMRFLERLRELACADCGRRFPTCVMEFDHRDPAAKRYGMNLIAGRVKFSRLLEESAKCDIVCSNCHRIRTTRRRRSSVAGVAQLAERDSSKVDVAGSSPVSRSALQQRLLEAPARCVAQPRIFAASPAL